MEKLIAQALRSKASDLFLVSGAVPCMRVDGALQQLGDEALTDRAVRDYFTKQLTPAQLATFKELHDLDFRFQAGGGSMRVNLHQQHGGIAAALRIIPDEIPSLASIDLESIAQIVSGYTSGLVLVTGTAGSGKSTTVASLIDHLTETWPAHVITVEDPIEYVFKGKRGVCEQREVTVDTPSFGSALCHVLRQNPDIIFIGEMRDAESIAAALTAAETGHLVFSTLHTPSAAETIERIIDLFSAERQKQILIQLASALRMVVSQRLLPRTGGGLVAAREVLTNTPAVANLIRNNNPAQIQSAIQTGKKEGMITLEKAMAQLVDAGLIEKG